MQGRLISPGRPALAARPLAPLRAGGLERPPPPRSVIAGAVRRSKAGDGGDQGASGAGPQPAKQLRRAAPSQPAAAPYPDALLQREYELWERQAGMYERLQEAHDRDLQRFAQERAGWAQQEAALRQEASELRAQLLYVLAQLNALQAQGAAAPPPAGFAGGGAPAGFASSQQSVRGGREPAASLPSSASSSPGPSPAEQIQAVIDAMKPPAGTTGSSWERAPAAPAAASSSSPVSPAEAWPGGGDELPAYAADLAAAVAAVDATDVLTGVSSYTLQGRRPAPAEEPATPAPQVVQQPPAAAPVAAAAAPAVEAPAAAAAEDRGPPPPLTLGADDIFWVNQLHTGLVDLGYFPGDEDIDDFYFGEGTQSALMTMQCCEGIEETGIADEATWARLLGPALQPRPSRDLTEDMMLNVPGLSKLGGGGSSSAADSSAAGDGGAKAAPAYAELFTAAFSETVAPTADGGLQDVQQLRVTDTVAAGGRVESDSVAVRQEVAVSPGGGAAKVTTSAAAAHTTSYTAWPVLHEGDGGREVHALQVALQKAGYYPGEDDMRWWSFGDGTLAALKTFQACNSYPESGVCDGATWRLLLGQDAQPNDLLQLRSGESDDEDLGDQNADRVWLIGEQRWEDRSRVKRG